MTTIGVAIPAHPPRVQDGMLNRALASVHAQTRLPDEIHVAIDTEKRGAWHTRQRALDAVTADFVAFLDADDEFLPNHLELHEQWAKEHDADFIYSWFEVHGDGRPAWDPFPPWFFTEPWHDDAPRHTTMTVMVRTELAQSIGFTAPGPGDITAANEDHRFIHAVHASGAKMVHIPGVRSWRWWWHLANTSGLTSKW